MVTAKQKVAITGIAGAGAGVAIPTLLGEFTSRATGQAGWSACGVKAGVKGVVGLLAYLLSGRLSEAGAMFAEIFAYTSWGSVIMDVLLAVYPGGIWGIAESMAVSVRVWARGAEKVVAELGAIEAGALKAEVGAMSVETSALPLKKAEVIGAM